MPSRDKEAHRTTLIVVGPLPPPIHGVTVSTSLILASEAVAAAFSVRHLDTSDHRSVETIARWDVRNLTLGGLHLVALVRMARRHRGAVMYLPLSQNSGAFIRDSLFIRIAGRYGIRTAAHLRGSEFRTHFYSRQRRPFRWWIRSALRRASSIAVLGESLRPVFDTLVDSEQIQVVPNGTPDIVKDWVQPRDYRHVVFLSNLRARKGVAEAVEAAMLVAESHPDARFTFAGDTDDPQLVASLRSRISGHNVVFQSSVDGSDKARLLTSAGILLFPPRLPEGQPRVILEAMAAGMAIVTTAQGAIAETVRDGLDGFVLPECDPDRLAEAIDRLLSDVELQKSMGQSSRRRYLDQYTLERADQRLVEWLRSIAAGDQRT